MNMKKLCMTAGLLLWSVGNHCMAYGLLSRIADSESALSSGLIVVCLYLAGAGLMGAAVYIELPKRAVKDSARGLCYLGGGYLVLQLLLSPLVGGLTWAMGWLTGLENAQIKAVSDVMCMIIQVPIRAGALILLLYIITGIERDLRAVMPKAAAACAVYAIVQVALKWMGTSLAALAVRIILSTAVTYALLRYVYREYKKGGTGDETVEQL